MIKIISDSSADVYSIEDVDFSCVPLKVRTTTKEYIDTGIEETRAMCDDLALTTDKSFTSCPNAEEWLNAFSKDKDNICFTISSNLSGSYNSCYQAKGIYEEEYNHKVVIIDSKSAASEVELLVRKAAELVKEGKTIDEVEKEVLDYQKTTHVFFLTSSINNFVRNGRVPPLVGKAISILNISLIGMGSEDGKIKMVGEARTNKKALQSIYERMKKRGYEGGKVIMANCFNDKGCEYLTNLIKEEYPSAEVIKDECGILCSYYVEEKGIIIGFEGKKDEDVLDRIKEIGEDIKERIER